MGYGLIGLTKLIYSELHEREINGKMEKCISIPLRMNGIEEDKNGDYNLRFITYKKKFKSYAKGDLFDLSVRIRDKALYFSLKSQGWYAQLRNIGYYASGKDDIVIVGRKASPKKFWDAIANIRRKNHEKKQAEEQKDYDYGGDDND